MRSIQRSMWGGGEGDEMTGKRKAKMPKLINLSKLRRRVGIIKIKKAGIYERWGKKVYAGAGR
jgi:hypothetical protein